MFDLTIFLSFLVNAKGRSSSCHLSEGEKRALFSCGLEKVSSLSTYTTTESPVGSLDVECSDIVLGFRESQEPPVNCDVIITSSVLCCRLLQILMHAHTWQREAGTHIGSLDL
jgi:hypothetical protein